jgi:hypothetical protein
MVEIFYRFYIEKYLYYHKNDGSAAIFLYDERREEFEI